MTALHSLLLLLTCALLAGCILAAASVVLTAAARALASPRWNARRPLSCDLCMSLLWTTPWMTAVGLGGVRLLLPGLPTSLLLVGGLAAWLTGAGLAWGALTVLDYFKQLWLRVGGDLQRLMPPAVDPAALDRMRQELDAALPASPPSGAPTSSIVR